MRDCVRGSLESQVRSRLEWWDSGGRVRSISVTRRTPARSKHVARYCASQAIFSVVQSSDWLYAAEAQRVHTWARVRDWVWSASGSEEHGRRTREKIWQRSSVGVLWIGVQVIGGHSNFDNFDSEHAGKMSDIVAK